MRPFITTTLPVYNAQEFLAQALASLARQTRLPDRVVVIDNCSTDATPEIVKNFKGLPLEYIRNPQNLGVYGNFNRCLDFAAETDYLQILHADDLITPTYYEKMVPLLEDCDGYGMAWCLDERIDENGRWLSVSGKATGKIEVLDKDTFLRRKSEIGNQAFCATLLKTNRRPIPARFPEDLLIVGDAVYWAKYGVHCKTIVTLDLPLAQYRWHSSNETILRATKIQGLIIEERRVMAEVEALRDRPWSGMMRKQKLEGLFAVRSGIKAKRFRQLGKADYADQIDKTVRSYTGFPIWLAARALVELREIIVFKIGGRPRQPSNVYS
jgi:glycosyltransferase involved in cell wall biosynthesis